jgi:hypothetical protein
MLSQWLQIEYYRLDCVETWEDGPRKQATRAAILNAIASLSGNGRDYTSSDSGAPWTRR